MDESNWKWVEAPSENTFRVDTDLNTILVVDDSPLDRRLIEGILQRSGQFQAIAVESGTAALAFLESQTVDLVVTDLQMPGLDGVRLVELAKSRWPTIPFVLVAAAGSEQAAMAALRAGAANYSPKSLLQRDLLETIRRVLDIQHHTSAAPRREGRKCDSVFVLENDTALIGPLIEHLQVQLPGWSDPARLQIGMALGEALTNAMHHGNLEVQSGLRSGDESAYHRLIQERQMQVPYRDRRVRVQVRVEIDRIEIEVRDEGCGFDPRRVPDPTAAENLVRLCGRGLTLIRAFMDDVHYTENGTRMVMIKRRFS